MPTTRIVRRGVTVVDVPELADLIARALVTPDPERVAGATAAFRSRFGEVRFAR